MWIAVDGCKSPDHRRRPRRGPSTYRSVSSLLGCSPFPSSSSLLRQRHGHHSAPTSPWNAPTVVSPMLRAPEGSRRAGQNPNVYAVEGLTLLRRALPLMAHGDATIGRPMKLHQHKPPLTSTHCASKDGSRCWQSESSRSPPATEVCGTVCLQSNMIESSALALWHVPQPEPHETVHSFLLPVLDTTVSSPERPLRLSSRLPACLKLSR